jgi:hypothetical protein
MFYHEKSGNPDVQWNFLLINQTYVNRATGCQ